MKQFDEKQIAGLQRLLSLLDPDSLTKEQFTEAFKKVLDYIKKIEDKNLSELDTMSKSLKSATEALKNATSNDFSGLKGEIIQLAQRQLAEVNTGLKKKIEEIDQRLSEIKDGEDADEDLIVDKVLEQIKFPEIKGIDEDLPKMGTQIRDALELLNGDERLDVSAIKGLQEMFDEIKSRKTVGGGGGFNYGSLDIHIIDDETPTGLVNGSNKDFVLSLVPSPASSLKLYKDGQRMKLTTDYTFSGRTVSFVDAPLTDSVITADYRV